jgi:hypothetical protein
VIFDVAERSKRSIASFDPAAPEAVRLLRSARPSLFHYRLSGLTKDDEVSVGRSSGATLAFGDRLVVSVVVVVVSVVLVQPTRASRQT